MILCVSFMLSAVVNMVGILLFNRSSVGYYATFVFGIAICIYVQSNFLNPKLSSLQGNEIDWTYYSREGIISGCFWVLCILIVIAAFFRWKSKAEKIMKYIAYFLSAVQTATLIVLLLTTKLNNNISFVFGTEGQFTIGSEKNIVVFVIDCLQSSTMQEYLISDAYEEG